MLRDELTLLIHSCDKYSDLWDAHVQLLNEYWPNRNIDTIIATDEATTVKYEGIRIIATGKGKEITERIKTVISDIKTEFVLVTLDDYFLIKEIDVEKMEELINIMKQHNLDYMRLFPLPNSNKKLYGLEGIFIINLHESKSNYYVNLYPGIWRKSFMGKTISESLNAWQYETSLTPIAQELNANCAMSKRKEFEILDVIRKGQILNKANRYFKKNPIYHGNRKVISWKDEMVINISTLLKRSLPKKMVQYLKRFMMNRGKTFYSKLDN